MTKNIAILGSTGSIGRSALSVIALYPEQFNVVALSAHSNAQLLIEQIERFSPTIVAVGTEQAYQVVRKACPHIEVVSGVEGFCRIACMEESDIMLSAMVGTSGLQPTYEALRLGKRVALANKEVMVAAGRLISEAAKQYSGEIIPVDSEHSAVFQCLASGCPEAVRSITLTASGGPFLHTDYEELCEVTPERALQHPNWSMGSKITIDSATMVNKGLELIEAKWLFDCCADMLRVVIHPQSIVHSMVSFVDGSVIAQLSVPDMKIPILYALTYPQRYQTEVAALNLAAAGSLEFIEPDAKKFPSLAVAYEVLASDDDSRVCVFDAANEVAVDAFLKGQISFLGIVDVIKRMLESIPAIPLQTIEDVVDFHQTCRIRTQEEIKRGQTAFV